MWKRGHGGGFVAEATQPKRSKSGVRRGPNGRGTIGLEMMSTTAKRWDAMIKAQRCQQQDGGDSSSS